MLLLGVTAGGAFPFRFRGQAVGAGGFGAQPFAVPRRFKPGRTGNRLLGIVEVRIFPEGWWQRRGCAQKRGVVGVRDLCRGEQEGIYPDAVYRALTVLSGLGTHEE